MLSGKTVVSRHMSGYGVNRDGQASDSRDTLAETTRRLPVPRMPNKHPLISTAVRAKLDSARVARLATLDDQQRPHLVPICFVLIANIFYSAIDRKPKRVAPKQLVRMRNLKNTPQMALLVDHYEEDWTLLWYVLVRGKAKLVSIPAERKHALQSLRVKYPQYRGEMLQEDAPILRIKPERITAWGNM